MAALAALDVEAHLSERRSKSGLLMAWFGMALCGCVSMGVALEVIANNGAVVSFSMQFLGALDPALPYVALLFLVASVGCGLLTTTVSLLQALILSLSTAQLQRLEAGLRCRRAAPRGLALESEPLNPRAQSQACASFCAELRGRGKVRGLVCTGVLLAIVLVLVQSVLAGAYLGFLQLGYDVMDQMGREGAAANASIGALGRDISTLQIAVFNKCCHERGWSVQGRVERCPSDGSAPACTVPARFAAYQSKLCTCYRSDRYDDMYRAVDKSTICQDLARLSISVDSTDLIPGTKLPIQAAVPVTTAQIVGYNGAPGTDPENSQTGYGCGFGGFAKPFQWIELRMLDQKARGACIIVIAISALQIMLMAYIRLLRVEISHDRWLMDQIDQVQARVLAHPDPHHGPGKNEDKSKRSAEESEPAAYSQRRAPQPPALVGSRLVDRMV
jgi:hypothetical protein